MSAQRLVSEAVRRLSLVRAQTVQLFDLVTSESVLRTEPMAGFRPLLWHLAHIGVYQNYWMLQRCAGQQSINPAYDVYFDPIKTPREEARRLPSRAEIDDYLAETFRRVEDFLDGNDLHTPREGGLSPAYAVDLVFEHESQHQETVAFVLQSLPYASKKPGPLPASHNRLLVPEDKELLVPAMSVPIGARTHGFVYDNELPAHTVDVAAFSIDRDLTTNGEYAEFVDAGGYERREFWSDAGWRWRESEAINLPLYWTPQRRERGFFAETALRENAPVTSISWHEACAYAKFRNKRLPTEAEWEVSASWDPEAKAMRRFTWGEKPASVERIGELRTNWGTLPIGSQVRYSSALGLRDAIGNLWQWTSSPFAGYPGFISYPYKEYSESWFDGDHYVARGGSWFTSLGLARTSFRNFYRRHFRPAFIGLRCARDAR